MNNNIPQFPTELPGTFWGLTVYYNPVRYKIKLDNYRRFRMASKRQGLQLICVELAFGDAPFELTEKDADQLIQIRGTSILWQKERLLNIAFEHLPNNCDKLVWLDADVVFLNDQWISQTRALLITHKVVQPFAFCARLPKGILNIDADSLPWGDTEGSKVCSLGYAISHYGQLQTPNGSGVTTGGAIAVRRSVLTGCGFYDRLVLGGGDTFMAYALFGGQVNPTLAFSQNMLEDLQRWATQVHQEVCTSITYTPGNLLHLWHGSSRYRSYSDRYSILRKHGFDPKTDIGIASNGCWEWATNKRALHRQVRRYFWLRNEDANLVFQVILECLKGFKKLYRFITSAISFRQDTGV